MKLSVAVHTLSLRFFVEFIFQGQQNYNQIDQAKNLSDTETQ